MKVYRDVVLVCSVLGVAVNQTAIAISFYLLRQGPQFYEADPLSILNLFGPTGSYLEAALLFGAVLTLVYSAFLITMHFMPTHNRWTPLCLKIGATLVVLLTLTLAVDCAHDLALALFKINLL